MVGRAEIFTKILGGPIADLLLKSAGLDGVARGAHAAMDLLAKDIDQREAADKVKRLADLLAREIATEGAKAFDAESVAVDAGRVAEALASAVRTLASAEALLARNLDAGRVAATLREVPRPDDLGTAEAELYDHALPRLARALVAKADSLPRFTGEMSRAFLDRIDALLAGQGRMAGTLSAIGAGVSRLAGDFADYESRFRNWMARTNETLELFGADIPEAAKEQALSVAYVSLSLSRTRRDGDSESRTAEGLFNALPGLGGRILIRGDAGSGKTTLMRWATVKMGQGLDGRSWETARKGRSDEDPNPPRDWRTLVPFLLRLREYDGDLPDVERFADKAAADIGTPPAGWILDVLRSGQGFILLDGVDEIPKFRRAKYAKRIRSLTENYPDCLFAVTSRPTAVPGDWLADCGFVNADINPLAPLDQTHLVEKWHLAMSSGADAKKKESLREHEAALKDRLVAEPGLARLGSNPLMLAMLCALHYGSRGNLPLRQYKLCDVLCRMLVHDRDILSRLNVGTIDPDYGRLDDDQKRMLLRDIAYHMVDDTKRPGGSTIRLDALDGILKEALAKFGQTVTDPAALRDVLIDRSGVLRKATNDHVDFIHNTLKEFLAAEKFITCGFAEKLAARADQREWWPVILLAAGGNNQDFSDRLIGDILEAASKVPEKKKRPLHILAWTCGVNAVAVSPELRAELANLEDDLVPPANLTEADMLASGGERVLDRLARRKPRGTAQTVATIRAVRTIGTSKAKCEILKFRDTKAKAVLDELVQILNPLSLPHVLERLRKGEGLEDGWRRFVSDLSPLSGLKGLQSLDLMDTGVTDVSALSGLTGLEYLDLGRTGVTDVSALSGLTGLQILDLSGTGVTDVSALSGLTGLEYLDLGRTGVTDVSTLSGLTGLQILDLSGTGVTDVSALSGLAGLELLKLGRTGVTDVSALSGLTGLQILDLSGTGVTDVSALSGLTGLEYLDLRRTGVTDVSTLSGLTGLQILDLSGTGVTDVPAMSGLTGLRILGMDRASRA
ncbi:leucine-rich repeat domain-containing protein [Skermanella mucosa]|uniref:NACHT domain-containing protein n=1 Tax=Skermanella mucosa TaxID=1789672 RepID=UPI00192C3C63|nr:leucine-rich repeat domain-containing protein [Skermanella mucosa]UEM22042.1 leucine-rich repeat domain-containing protein [Skermanella mucosa]